MKTKKIFAISMIILVILLFIIPIIVWHNYNAKWKFTSEKWKTTNDSKIYHMVDNLEKTYKLKGMTKKEIEELLGTPSMEYSYSIEYRTKDDMISGWKVLAFQFEDGKVVKVYEDLEDW